MTKSSSWDIEMKMFIQYDISKYEGHDRCFSKMRDESWLWHKRLRHVNMNLITQLNKNEFVRGLPKISFEKDKVCEA